MPSEIKDNQVQSISLVEHFAELPDPRVERTKLHSLVDILIIAICAAICGAEGWTDVAEFGKTKEKWLRKFLVLKNGIPSHDTFGRVFSLIDPAAFERCFVSWVKALSGVNLDEALAETIGVDGKTSRRSHDKHNNKAALHLVSAWASERGLVLGQRAVDSKSNEITAIPQLLEMLELKGCLVSIDAMGCQTEIAEQIVEQGGDYLLAVKDNQKHLAQDIKETFAIEFEQAVPFEGIEHDYDQTIEKNRGRIEIRQCWTISEPEFIQYLRNSDAWSGLQTIALVRSTRRTKAGETVLDRYYISSLPGAAKPILKAVRSHWGIENSLHWVLDVVFNEDQARMRTGHMAHNFAVLRHIALNLLRQEKSSSKSIRAKRFRAALDENYLFKVLSSLF